MLWNRKVLRGREDHQSSSSWIFCPEWITQEKKHPQPEEPSQAVNNEQEKESNGIIPALDKKWISLTPKLFIM